MPRNEPSFPTFSNWQNVNQDLKQSGHTPSLSCRELKWGDQRMRELIYLRVKEKDDERERERGKVFEQRCLRLACENGSVSCLQHSYPPPSFPLPLPSDRKQLVCAKGAQMRRLNKALDAHSKALLLILQVSAEPLWPVTCPELCCFARLWVDLAQGIMHEFGHSHMCWRLNSIDEDVCQQCWRLLTNCNPLLISNYMMKTAVSNAIHYITHLK